jgi:hypothetical protein
MTEGTDEQPDVRKVHGRTEMHGSAAVSVTATREFWEVNKPLLALVIAISIVSSFVGLIVPGALGVVVGLLLSAVGFVVGIPAFTRYRER